MCDYSLKSSRSIPNENLELPESVRDGIRKMHEGWNSRLHCEHFDAAKEYIDGRIGLLIQFDSASGPRINDGPPIPSHLEGAIFKFSDGPTIWAYNFDTLHSGHPNDRDHDRMLIGIVQSMQSMQFVAAPTSVCRETDKEFLRIGTRRFYSVTRGFVIPLENPSREGQKLILCAAVNPNQFPRSVVENGAEVVNGVTNYQSKTFRNWVAKTNLDGDLSIRITADAKRVGVSIHEGGKGRLKIVDMMLGPL